MSAFNFAQIIIHPFGRLCRIQINKKKENISSLSPLNNYLTVNKASLPMLIGVSLVVATENISFHGKEATKHQYIEREETINAIRKEFKE